MTPTPTATTPIPDSSIQVPAQYDLEAVFDYYAHSLAVTETITYTNLTTETIPDLVLVVEANRWTGSYNMTSLAWNTGEAVQGYDLQEAELHISLPQPLQPDEQLGLKVVYQLDLPEIPAPSEVSRPVPYGYSERQTNIVDWYPYVPPYIPATGWLVHPKWWFGEHQVLDVADFQVELTLSQPVPDLVIAASAPAEGSGDGYIYHLQAARSFALSASTQYLVQSIQVGNVTVNSYSFPYDKAGGEQVLQDTAQALELYDRLLAPYPHQTLSAVEADFLDGMEYDGLYFLSRGFYNLYDGTPQGYLTFIAAHETAHQWWYGLVGNDQALEPWLDEAMCTYMEHIYYENMYPDYTTSSGQSLVDWWWYYRVNFYDPNGWINGSIYDYSLFRPYRDAVYLNGAKFLQDLRTLIGDQAFFAFLKDYAIQNEHRIASANDFFDILKNHTDKSFDDLISSYFKPSE
jgi:Peptidase family M1 domain